MNAYNIISIQSNPIIMPVRRVSIYTNVNNYVACM